MFTDNGILEDTYSGNNRIHKNTKNFKYIGKVVIYFMSFS